MAHPVIDETGKARLPRPPPGLIALLKGSKHIAAVMSILAVSAALWLAALGLEKAGIPVSAEAHATLQAFYGLAEYAMGAVGVSSLRHYGKDAKGEAP